MMLLNISTRKYPNTFVKLDDEVHEFLMTIKSRNGAVKKWRCHSGSKGDRSVITTQCLKNFVPRTISLAWIVYNFLQKEVVVDMHNLDVWGRPLPRDARLMYRDRDSLNLQVDNLVMAFRGHSLPNREPLAILASTPFDKRES